MSDSAALPSLRRPARPRRLVAGGPKRRSALAHPLVRATRHHRAPYVALIFGIACIAWSAIFVRLAAVSGLASAFYRMAFACTVLWPWWAARPPKRLPAGAVRLAMAGGVCFALDLAMWNVSIMTTAAANATLLANNAPIFVALGAFFLFGERPGLGFWGGLVLAMAGAATVVAADFLRHPALGWGDSLALAASVSYASYLLVTQRAREQLDTLSFMTIATTTSGIVLFLLCLAFRSPLAGYTARTWLMLAGLGLVTHVLGWVAVNYSLGTLPAAAVSVSLLSQVPLTALLAALLLDEAITWPQVAGGAILLLGITVVIASGSQREARRPEGGSRGTLERGSA